VGYITRYVALGLAVVSFGIGLWTSREQYLDSSRSKATTECQTRINQQFLSVLKERARLGQENSTNINNLVKAVFTAKDSKTAMADYQRYLTELDRINGETQRATYPDLQSC
jgi:hypothetical protein